MAAVLASLPGLVVADFADFVGTAKEATKNTFAGSQPVVVPKQLSVSEHLATFWDRNSPSDFVGEFAAIVFIAVYVALYFYGKGINERLAKERFQAIYKQLVDNFAQVGLESNSAPLSSDGPENFVSYATGRKNVKFAHIRLQSFPRHDLVVAYPLKSLYGLYFDQESLVDRLTMEFTLPDAFDGFVFGLLNKNVMRYQRTANWDLTFTKTNDATFSNHFVVMTEVAEVSDMILSKELTTLATEMADSLEYLVLSDQPTTQPKTGEQDKSVRQLRFSVLLGRPSSNRENLNLLLASVLNLVDALPKQSAKLTNNGQKKLAASREEVYKAIAKKVAAEEAEDAPKRLTRKEVREKEKKDSLGKLSAKEQKRALEKERERAMKKGQSKMSKRG